jgi:hypothetical protein
MFDSRLGTILIQMKIMLRESSARREMRKRLENSEDYVLRPSVSFIRG